MSGGVDLRGDALHDQWLQDRDRPAPTRPQPGMTPARMAELRGALYELEWNGLDDWQRASVARMRRVLDAVEGVGVVEVAER